MAKTTAKCVSCKGFGYYYLHKDAAGTKADVKKVCGACGGSGEKTERKK